MTTAPNIAYHSDGTEHSLNEQSECEQCNPPQPVDLVALFDQLARDNSASGEHTRIAAGTFALYPAPGGGVVLVLNVDEGPDGLRGTLRKKLGPGLIRALQAFGDNGPNPAKMISAIMKGRKRDRTG